MTFPSKVCVFALPLTLCLVHGRAAKYVDNFVLLDQNGRAHELYYHSDAKAVVLMVQGNGCPIVRNALPVLKKIRDKYLDRGVRFLLLNSNLQDSRESIRQEAEKYGIDFPVLIDETQLIGESLGLDRTAEVLVLDPKNWAIIYRGAIDDRLDYEKQKKEAKEHYLVDALEAHLNGKRIKVSKRDFPGCLINFAELSEKDQHRNISYSKTIAPMLEEHCVSCHRIGGIGPWPMTSYRKIRGFAPMIREVVRTKRMPPWHADPMVNRFQNDPSLSREEMKTLIHWIEAGSPRGEGVDPLKDIRPVEERWALGEPDLILELPAFRVPATGVINYQFPSLVNPLGEERWLRAAQMLPGDAEVLHHSIISVSQGGQIFGGGGRLRAVHLFTFAPGTPAELYPKNSGVRIPKDGRFIFQMHYTTSGREVTDRTRVGLYFHKSKPTYELQHFAMMDPSLWILPGVKEHSETVYFEFQHDAMVHSLFPHAHYRGKASSFKAIYPDGKEKMLLSVPNYDFNWQRYFKFEKPEFVPAGTKIVHTTSWDNSPQKTGNPDPKKTVGWGLQSWDEMLYGGMVFTYADPEVPSRFDDPLYVEGLVSVGYLDTDMNGRVEYRELPALFTLGLQGRFDEFDTNHDGGWDAEEYVAFRRATKK